MTATEFLDELDAARAEATPGEWGAARARANGCVNLDATTRANGFLAYTRIGEAVRSADAALIVAAVNALPKLTAAVRAMEALAERWGRDLSPHWREASAVLADALAGDS